ncbi:cytochrome d ubiquinol oxidase subunit II [Brevibacillus sp. M2.1A]|uniref:cytochrome d ubiquinol oxidase subunit II n=1 Tax=Brevibacillus TaxID=55080 RepID=UPI00156B9E0D|nr:MULTISPECIES: cytochrome d ubiquinol oxidase subunit II [Brevibacillus]MCC8437919.1 cytochrome d ubiquinol oxidase subunit II [Brevibacillus sp. M2.1A]UKL00023.1 cytochrome d ubiquinol oxidase subunit II [Brevibacillus brevis]
MGLNELWFLLIAVLFTGFFFLEGFDFGVGMATRLLSRNDLQTRVLINTIGPFWDANEVWLITAAGAMFAAFPEWYSTMFSGYYLVLTLILLALIGRGVAFEFRGKGKGEAWKKTWDAAILIGSFVPPMLFGMVFASLVKGVPIDQNMEMTAGFSDIVNGYSLWAGVTVTGLCLLHGLNFISLRTVGELREKSRVLAAKLLPVQAVLMAVLVGWTFMVTDLFERQGVLLTAATLLGVIAFVLARHYLRQGREGWAFGMTGAMILLTFVSMFIGLFPRVMVSTIDSAFDLTLYNAASSPYTLKAMTIVAAVLLPFVLAYQAWSYFVFHKRVTEKDHLEY